MIIPWRPVYKKALHSNLEEAEDIVRTGRGQRGCGKCPVDIVHTFHIHSYAPLMKTLCEEVGHLCDTKEGEN